MCRSIFFLFIVCIVYGVFGIPIRARADIIEMSAFIIFPMESSSETVSQVSSNSISSGSSVIGTVASDIAPKSVEENLPILESVIDKVLPQEVPDKPETIQEFEVQVSIDPEAIIIPSVVLDKPLTTVKSGENVPTFESTSPLPTQEVSSEIITETIVEPPGAIQGALQPQPQPKIKIKSLEANVSVAVVALQNAVVALQNIVLNVMVNVKAVLLETWKTILDIIPKF